MNQDSFSQPLKRKMKGKCEHIFLSKAKESKMGPQPHLSYPAIWKMKGKCEHIDNTKHYTPHLVNYPLMLNSLNTLINNEIGLIKIDSKEVFSRDSYRNFVRLF